MRRLLFGICFTVSGASGNLMIKLAIAGQGWGDAARSKPPERFAGDLNRRGVLAS